MYNICTKHKDFLSKIFFTMQPVASYGWDQGCSCPPLSFCPIRECFCPNLVHFSFKLCSWWQQSKWFLL